MSEHAWTLENLAAYVADGLGAAERERLEQHLAGCFDCTSALEATRAADWQLMSLFADIRPGPALEDRMVRSLAYTAARKFAPPMWVKAVLATAALVPIAVGGAVISSLIEGGRFDTLFALSDATPEEGDRTDIMRARQRST